MTESYGVADLKPFLDADASVLGDEKASFTHVASASDAGNGALVWIRPTRADKQQLLDETGASVVLCDDSIDPAKAIEGGKCVILVGNPKVVFSRAANALFVKEPTWGVHESSLVHASAKLPARVSVGPGCTIGRVEIGEGTIIHGNCHIYDGVKIGRNVTIHAGTIIGGDGFGYERDEDGEVEKFPHVGGVIIDDDVEIHSCTAVDRGSLGDTRIRRGVKIDNLVHVAHNVDIGEGSFVIAHAMLGGSVKIGRNCWIGPGALLRDNLTIGDGAFIGIGALVVKDVPGGSVQMGAPAREADEYKALLQAFRALLPSKD